MANTLLINIDVPDLQKGIGFYTSALGLRHTRVLFDGNVAEMIHDGAAMRIYLLQEDEASIATREPENLRNYNRHWTPVHMDFVVEDLDTSVARALSAGAMQETKIGHHAWGNIAVMADPFGNGFCLLQFFGNGYGEDV